MKIFIFILLSIPLLCKAQEQVVSTTQMMSAEYDIVVFVNDVGTNLGADLFEIETAIRAFKEINPKAPHSLSIIPFPAHPCRKLLFSSTGDLHSDLADVRVIYNAAKKAMDKVFAMGFKKILLIVGPMNGALPEATWAHGHYPKLNAALGALYSLYVPIQVREMTDLKSKFDMLGLYNYDEKLTKAIMAVNKGCGVDRDIGNAGPARMLPIRIVEYLQTKEAHWNSAQISMHVEDPDKENHPLAYAVNRAASIVKEQQGKIVYLEYSPPGPINQTLLLVGKGITFDTGGADLKTSYGMYGMHNDKMGAASIAGFFEVLSYLKPKGLKVYAYLPFVRNGIGKMALLPDEILVTRNNLRVRIGNTDAEGRMVMGDVLNQAKEMALKSVNPHVFTIATLTGGAVRAFGKITVSMDNGPARSLGMAEQLSETGYLCSDLTEVARILVEDFEVNYPISEYEDVEQFNTLPGVLSSRSFTFPMGFLSIVSGLNKHGVGSTFPIPYTHMDIAGSAGGIGVLGTGTPVRLLATQFILPRFL